MHNLVLVGRSVVCVLALWNLRWSFRGACEMARGGFLPPAIYLSVVFWISLAALSFQGGWYFGATDLWRGFSIILLLAALGTAAIGQRRGVTLKARQFYRMYDHLSEAQAISDLADLDPAAAEQIAAQCRSLTAAALIARHG